MCWPSKDLLRISKESWCSVEKRLGLHQQFLLFSLRTNQLKELPTVKAQQNLKIWISTWMFTAWDLEIFSLSQLRVSVENHKYFLSFSLKMSSEEQCRAVWVSDWKKLFKHIPSETLKPCWLCALIEQLWPFFVPDLLEIFDARRSRPCCRLLYCSQLSKVGRKDGGADRCRSWRHWWASVLLYLLRNEGATKIGFHVLVARLLTAAPSPRCPIVTSTNCEMVPSMHWGAHLRGGLHIIAQLQSWIRAELRSICSFCRTQTHRIQRNGCFNLSDLHRDRVHPLSLLLPQRYSEGHCAALVCRGKMDVCTLRVISASQMFSNLLLKRPVGLLWHHRVRKHQLICWLTLSSINNVSFSFIR